MIKLFRNIRQNLLAAGKTSKYLKYAIGEIILVVIGILIALQVNNWNEKRKQDKQFKINLELIYNSILVDSENFENDINILTYQIAVIDTLLYVPDSIPPKELPYRLYSLDYVYNSFTSEAVYYSKNLMYNPNDLRENQISKQIVNYVNSINITLDSAKPFFDKLQGLEIPLPKNNLINFEWDKSDTLYYSTNDIKILENLIQINSFRTLLKTQRSIKNAYTIGLKNFLSDSKSVLNLIKTYYPEVKLLYIDVGIIGTSINGYDDDGAKSTPMSLTDATNNIWEIDMYLKKGTVKFRCRDSWADNWGGSDFPEGSAAKNGSNIPIEAGDYHITLDLKTASYKFVKKIPAPINLEN